MRRKKHWNSKHKMRKSSRRYTCFDSGALFLPTLHVDPVTRSISQRIICWFFCCAFVCRHHRIYMPSNLLLTMLFDSVATAHIHRSLARSLARWFVAKHFFSGWIISQVDGNWVAVWQYLFGEVRHLELWSFDVGNRNTGLDTISRHCCSRCHAKGKQTS